MDDRKFDFDIMDEMKNRWSPRAISREKVADEKIMSILEAARYAPSCMNEQSWKFIVAKEEGELKKMQSVLAETNQIWANKAPVLIMVLARVTFALNGKVNRWHMFDAGTASGFLAIEAQRQGLIAHSMGGFSAEAASSLYDLSEDIVPISVIAVGYYGDKNELPDYLQAREVKGTRLELEQLIIK